MAGELECSEAEVVRRLLDRAMAQGGPKLLAELRAEIHAEREAEPTERELEAKLRAHEARHA